MTTGLLLIIALAMILLLAFLVAQFAVTLARRDTVSVVSGPRPENWKRALHGARRRSGIAAALGGIVLIVLVLIPYPAGWQRVGILVAPLLAVAVGLAAFAGLPVRADQRQDQRQDQDAEVVGSQPGKAFAFVSPGYAGVLVGAFLALAAVIAIMGAAGGADNAGQWGRGLRLQRAGLSATVDNFPGWYFGLPVLIAAAVLAAACAASLRRVGVTPSLPGHGLSAASRRWSVGSARVLVLITLSALFLEMAALLFMAMAAARRGLSDMGLSSRSAWMTALAQVVVAAGLAAFGCLAHAVYNSVTLPQRTAAAMVVHDDGLSRP